jgi:ABC-type multidrug transport system fused ATPase/permease subunit
VVAAIAVFVTDPLWTYLAAGLALALAIGWAWISWLFRESRALAERARRANLLMQGLGESISKNELRDLEARFTVTSAAGVALENFDYYETKLKPGQERLAKILEESAFWSAHLLRYSAQRTWMQFVVFFLVGAVLFFAAIPFVNAEQLQIGARVFCAFLTLLVSAEILGAALSYTSAASIVGNILSRIEALEFSGYPRADMLMVLSDYNSAVESAPMFRSGLYEKHCDRLNDLWCTKPNRSRRSVKKPPD